MSVPATCTSVFFIIQGSKSCTKGDTRQGCVLPRRLLVRGEPSPGLVWAAGRQPRVLPPRVEVAKGRRATATQKAAFYPLPGRASPVL